MLKLLGNIVELADKQAIPLQQNRTFIPPANGWYIPDARMKDILDRLDRCK